MKREFLQQAQKYKPEKHDISGYFISEKLDGMRCFWDGGISRGLPTVQVPWANIHHPKTGELKTKIKPVATGLWSRYGNPIMAPDWWLNDLPQMLLDGELWAGRQTFQTLRSITSRDKPDDRWKLVQFAVYGCPPISQLFRAGEINNSSFVKTIDPVVISEFIEGRREAGVTIEMDEAHQNRTFSEELICLNSTLPCEGLVHAHHHTLLPNDWKQAGIVLAECAKRVCDLGGEGLVMRAPKSIWTPKRVHQCLKVKPFKDDCGVVTGFTSGSVTTKGSKARGLIGAIILEYKGKRLEMSGMNYSDERAFSKASERKYAWNHPGEDMPSHFQGKSFKVGDKVEFRYSGKSKDGLPKEARYLREV